MKRKESISITYDISRFENGLIKASKKIRMLRMRIRCTIDAVNIANKALQTEREK